MHDNGQVRLLAQSKVGNLDGLWIYYNENRTAESRRAHKDGEPIDYPIQLPTLAPRSRRCLAPRQKKDLHSPSLPTDHSLL